MSTSWLPSGFEFLSGVPEAARKRRLIVSIQAYVDETGGKGQGVFLFSALLATAWDWAAISDRWRQALDEAPRIDYFKMDEAAGRDGQFRGLSPLERDDKLISLASALTAEYPILEQTVTVDLEAIKTHLVPRSRKPFREPYFWPFHILIQGIGCSLLARTEYDEPFEIYFDENVIFGTRAKAWYPVMRAMAEPRLRALLPVEPIFRDDKTTMPLQAADLAAWMTRYDNSGSNPFAWLRAHLAGVRKSPDCLTFGKDDIDKMYGSGEPIPADLQWRVDAANKAFEDTFVKGGARHFVPKPKKPKKPRG